MIDIGLVYIYPTILTSEAYLWDNDSEKTSLLSMTNIYKKNQI